MVACELVEFTGVFVSMLAELRPWLFLFNAALALGKNEDDVACRAELFFFEAHILSPQLMFSNNICF